MRDDASVRSLGEWVIGESAMATTARIRAEANIRHTKAPTRKELERMINYLRIRAREADKARLINEFTRVRPS